MNLQKSPGHRNDSQSLLGSEILLGLLGKPKVALFCILRWFISRLEEKYIAVDEYNKYFK